MNESATESPGLLGECRDKALDRLLQALSTMFGKIDDILFDLANKSTDLNDYNLYLDARGKIKERRHAIEIEFRRRFIETFNQATRREKVTQTGFELADGSSISLVENDELAESVAAGDIGRRLKNRCPEQLFALTRRVGELMEDPELPEAANPFNPTVICEAFKAACQELNADVRIKLVLLEHFENFIGHDIEDLYNQLNQHLILRNVLPKIRISVPKNPARSVPPGSLLPKELAEHDLFAALTQLMASGSPRGFAPLAEPRTQVLSALTEMQRGNFANLKPLSVGDATNVIRELREAGFGAGLPQMDAMTLDIVALLFDYILDDKDIPTAMKALIGRLQIPVLKVAMLDKKFFAKKSHPARRLLDQLAYAAIGWSQEDENDRLYTKVEALVQSILSDFEEDTAIFARVLSELEEFLHEEERLAKDRAQDSIKEIEVRERAEIAQVMAGAEITRRLAANGVPNAVKVFLEGQWTILLARAHQTEGEDSSAWKEGLAAMDDLIWSVGAKQTADDRKRLVELLPHLLQRLKQGMERAAISPDAREHFFAELVNLHAGAVRAGLETAVAPVFENTASQVAEQLPIDLGSGDSDLPMQRGMWVEFAYEDGSHGRAKLAWISPLRRNYLFTNRQGLKPLAISAHDLADRFRNGSAQIIHEAPLIDRAVTNVLDGLRREAVEC
ncbi:MAG TPA: DUF1631 domain-containing protein [Burkholderiales bacterium]|nr:DUF1631 domain-containing protein [Burkholderiales bacterium]